MFNDQLLIPSKFQTTYVTYDYDLLVLNNRKNIINGFSFLFLHFSCFALVPFSHHICKISSSYFNVYLNIVGSSYFQCRTPGFCRSSTPFIRISNHLCPIYPLKSRTNRLSVRISFTFPFSFFSLCLNTVHAYISVNTMK